MRWFFALSILLTLLCSSSGPAAYAQQQTTHRCHGFKTSVGRDHPLACRYFAADGREFSQQGLAKALGDAPFVLLGEVHDHPDHHEVRGELIDLLNPRDQRPTDALALPLRPPALVFEHIRADQTGAVDTYLRAIAVASSDEQRHEALRAVESGLDWTKSGWPAFNLFKPLFVSADWGRHPIAAGDPPRTDVRRLAREGLTALAEPERQRLKLDEPLPHALQDALLTELEASHCGLMSKTAFGSMAFAQRYRDAYLATALAAAADKHGSAVLLAGNGHVRADRGVPYYLRQMSPGRKFVSVLLLEVEDSKSDFATYIERDPDGKPVTDYIILTPRVERPDPCAAMKARFAKPPQ